MKPTLLSAAALSLIACATTPQPSPVPYASEASRSDATVVMTSGSLSGLMVLANLPATHWNWTGAQRVASARCRVWGYGSAEPLSPVIRICGGQDAFGSCSSLRYDRTYQCVDDGVADLATSGASDSASDAEPAAPSDP